MPAEIALIAAMRRELWPLVKRWNRLATDSPAEMYVHGDVLASCGGIGPAAARCAAEIAIVLCEPKLVVSVGLAGGLDPACKVGSTMIPATIIEMDTGEEFETGGGQGVLVSSPQVLDVHEKRRVRRQYSAAAVDMEAAAVAGVARKHGVPFMAIKAISDDARFSMPEFGRWIDQQGTLHTGRFLAAHLLRPMSWSRMARLAINSRRASRKLCEVLAHHIEQQSFHRQGASPREALSPKRN